MLQSSLTRTPYSGRTAVDPFKIFWLEPTQWVILPYRLLIHHRQNDICTGGCTQEEEAGETDPLPHSYMYTSCVGSVLWGGSSPCPFCWGQCNIIITFIIAVILTIVTVNTQQRQKQSWRRWRKEQYTTSCIIAEAVGIPEQGLPTTSLAPSPSTPSLCFCRSQ